MSEQERDIVERWVRTIYKHGYARGASDESKDDFDPSRESDRYVASEPSVVRDIRAELARRPTGEEAEAIRLWVEMAPKDRHGDPLVAFEDEWVRDGLGHIAAPQSGFTLFECRRLTPVPTEDSDG